MQLNKPIIIGAFLIAGTGLYRVLILKDTNSSATRVVMGSYLLALLLSLVDLIGGPASQIASGLMMLAVGANLLIVVPDIAGKITAQTTGAAAGGGGSAGGF